MTVDSVLRRSRFVLEEPGGKQVMIMSEIRHEVLMGCATSSDVLVSLKVALNFRLEKLGVLFDRSKRKFVLLTIKRS